MRKLLRSAAVSAALCGMTIVSPAAASEKAFGPFVVDDAKPDVIVMNGDIDVGSALNFRRALHAAPALNLLP
ncbi:hypothetical protein [Rhizobium sp. L43]|uniref:hypothetical protein n=1 Tax=Rhizobium sp. L43 TaxID=2035452 RepID=UPI000BE903E1|nr:hypothetical protein [Rhizobium sp. L43]PDS79475.1 hypothetical protein CO667_07770 [Rhizobium sp. L43]